MGWFEIFVKKNFTEQGVLYLFNHASIISTSFLSTLVSRAGINMKEYDLEYHLPLFSVA